jgi:hypothetical protein
LDELRRMGQAQREAEARRMEELLQKSNEAAAAAVARRAKEEEGEGERNGGVTKKEGEETLDEEEEGEEGREGGRAGDATAAAAAAAAAAVALGIGTSAEVKAKWKRSSLAESHSDESLYQLLVRFGPIKSVEMTGVKVRRGGREGGRERGSVTADAQSSMSFITIILIRLLFSSTSSFLPFLPPSFLRHRATPPRSSSKNAQLQNAQSLPMSSTPTCVSPSQPTRNTDSSSLKS